MKAFIEENKSKVSRDRLFGGYDLPKYDYDRLTDKCHEFISGKMNAEFPRPDINSGEYHDYYKNKVSYIKVNISDRGEYIVTKVNPNGKCFGISQYILNTTDFLKYYEMCSKSEWEGALSRLNMWLKDANLKVKDI